MRTVLNPQMQFGTVDISKITFDPKSRDDIPQVLRGLQYIYSHPDLRAEVFKILEENIAPGKDKKNGRPGMELWKIFVLAVVRVNLNTDYDRLHELANNHLVMRQMMGHSTVFDRSYYELQTIKDNVQMVTPEMLDKINQVVVKAGHKLLKKKDLDPLKIRCDSFVVETNVHYPTDINLLLDAMRKIIFLTAGLCDENGITDWRQHQYAYRKVKKLMRACQNKKRGNPKSEEQRKKKEADLKEFHQAYISMCSALIERSILSLGNVPDTNFMVEMKKQEIANFMNHARRQVNQIDRRVIQGQVIPHEEKYFSVFETHTEWISKGKAGVPVELGLKVCVVEDQYQFILYHQVMEKKTDEEICIPLVRETKERFPEVEQASFDKGFHSPANQNDLQQLVRMPVLSRKGKLSKQAREIEGSPEFRKARHQHPAVESAINALEVHGLDYCPDRGIYGFKRYVSLAIVGRNLQRVGAILQGRDRKKLQKNLKKYTNVQYGHLGSRVAA
jgi:transposase, IS5 family